MILGFTYAVHAGTREYSALGRVGQPAGAGTRDLVRAVHADDRRADLRSAGVAVRAGGSWTRGAGGDARRQPARAAGSGRRCRSSSRSRPRCASARAGRSAVRARSCRSARRWGRSLGQLAARVRSRSCGCWSRAAPRGGISATFNAPIAGVFFALELILRNFGRESFGWSCSSSVDRRRDRARGVRLKPFLTLPAFSFSSPLELVLYAGSGCSRSASASRSSACCTAGEDLADRLWRGPEWLRPGGRRHPARRCCCSRSRRCTASATRCCSRRSRATTWCWLLLGLLAAKILATSLTMWIGGSGGVFAPSLFMGAMLGSAYGAVAHQLIPGWPARRRLRPGRDGRGVRRRGRAPITAVIIIFELTGDYRIILPLMFAVVVATALSNAVTKRHDLHAQAAPRAGSTSTRRRRRAGWRGSRSATRWDGYPPRSAPEQPLESLVRGSPPNGPSRCR